MNIEGIVQIGRLVVFLLLASAALFIVLSTQNMHKITIRKNNQKIILTATDDGIIKTASVSPQEWKDRVIIKVNTLVPGDLLTVYDLYTDVEFPEVYPVIKVDYEAVVFGR